MFSLLTLRIILYSIIQLWMKAISVEEFISSKLIYFNDLISELLNTFVYICYILFKDNKYFINFVDEILLIRI